MSDNIKLCWLGQGGFLISYNNINVLIDPYLSNYCLKLKSEFNHTRCTPIVRDPAAIKADFYLITHAHGDHFDPESISPVMQNNPDCRFLCTGDCKSKIEQFFPDEFARFEFVKIGKMISVSPELELHVIPAAHEELTKDADGEYIAVSYMLNFTKEHKTVFFGGDTIPYNGQDKNITALIPDDHELIMCLPANGRDEARHTLGIVGNMDINEAIELAKKCNAKLLIPCHIGMFAGNDAVEKISIEYCEKHGIKTFMPEAGKDFYL